MRKRKMSIEQYLEREFTPESRPTQKTIVNGIKNGQVDGVKFGGKWWVYETLPEADRMVERVLRSAGTGHAVGAIAICPQTFTLIAKVAPSTTGTSTHTPENRTAWVQTARRRYWQRSSSTACCWSRCRWLTGCWARPRCSRHGWRNTNGSGSKRRTWPRRASEA